VELRSKGELRMGAIFKEESYEKDFREKLVKTSGGAEDKL